MGYGNRFGCRAVAAIGCGGRFGCEQPVGVGNRTHFGCEGRHCGGISAIGVWAGAVRVPPPDLDVKTDRCSGVNSYRT